MSEEKKDFQKGERKPYTVNVKPLAFEADFSGKFITSKDLCNLTNKVFRAAYSDFVGSQFEINNGQPTISLYFDHAKTTDGTYACERISDKTVGNSIIDKTRGRDMQMKEGDRYHLTQDGEDFIKTLLCQRFYNQGKPNWKTIVSDVTERTAASYYQPQNVQQMTKVIGIDPVAICKILWGAEEGEGQEKSYIDYGVEVKTNLTAGMLNVNPNYLLGITKAYTGQITKTYEKLGIGMVGSTIVR